MKTAEKQQFPENGGSQLLEDRINNSLREIWDVLEEKHVPTPDIVFPNHAPRWHEEKVFDHLISWAANLPFMSKIDRGIFTTISSSKIGIEFNQGGDSSLLLEIEFPENENADYEVGWSVVIF